MVLPPIYTEESYFFRNSTEFNDTTKELQYYLVWIRSSKSNIREKKNNEIGARRSKLSFLIVWYSLN